MCRRVCDSIGAVMKTVDGLIVLDQVDEEDWGVVPGRVRKFLEQITRDMPDKLIYVDSRAHLRQFEFGVLKGNRVELLAAAGLEQDDDESTRKAVQVLSGRTGRAVFATLGEDGVLVARPGCQPEHVPGCPAPGPVDIVGAGDSATSGIVSSLLCGADEIEAATMGNLAASITVQQLGTTGTASPAQIRARWTECFS
jgi:bifunctional ADP-heptose synthase (sugar kinase/adenylyltransferase)